MDGEVIIRDARLEDCESVEQMITELAIFEKMPDGVKIDHKVLQRDGGFLGGPKFFHCNVAELVETKQIIGYVLSYFKYSTWEGKAIHMEDLYVKPEYRHRKIGMRLWQSVAKRAVSDSCSRLDFAVLSWNQNAIDVYKKHGAVNISEMEGWHCFRLNAMSIDNLANTDFTSK